MTDNGSCPINTRSYRTDATSNFVLVDGVWKLEGGDLISRGGGRRHRASEMRTDRAGGAGDVRRGTGRRPRRHREQRERWGQGGTVERRGTSDGVDHGESSGGVVSMGMDDVGQIAGIWCRHTGSCCHRRNRRDERDRRSVGALRDVLRRVSRLHHLRLVDVTVTPGGSDPGAVRLCRADVIQLPETLVNPPVDTRRGRQPRDVAGGRRRPTYEPITAEAGSAWITVTPQIGTTTFSFGNGDEVSCDGFGVEIADLESVDEGPCGYTLRQPGDSTITITSTWDLPYSSSAGPGALTPMERTVTLSLRGHRDPDRRRQRLTPRTSVGGAVDAGFGGGLFASEVFDEVDQLLHHLVGEAANLLG